MRCLCVLATLCFAIHAEALCQEGQIVFQGAGEDSGPNRVVNPDFEAGPQPWQGWKQGFERAEGPGAHSGNACARLASRDLKTEYGVFQRVELNQREPALVIVKAWSRAEDVSGDANSGYSLYIDVQYMDGTHLWQQTAPFPTGTHGWVRRQVVIMPAKPIKLLLVYGLLRGHTGAAYFDDFTLSVPKQGGLFDGVPVAAKGLGPAAGPGASAKVTTSDGLALAFDEAGRVLSVGRARESADARLAPQSGFFVRDAAAESAFVRPATVVSRDGDGIRLAGSCAEVGLTLDARVAAASERITVTGTVADTTGRDRCVSVYFALPLNLDAAVWWRDVSVKRDVKPGLQYGNWTNLGVGANAFASKYPWCAVTTPSEGLSLYVPMDRPQVMRMGVSAGLTYIVFDLGLSAKAARMRSKASFEFGLYRHDPAWGFRSAAQRYYDMFAQWFTKRVQSEGIWLITRSIKAIRGPEDFHLKFHETGARVDPGGVPLGIQSFRYTEPWRWRQRYGRERGAGTPEQRTREGSLAELEKRLESTDASVRRHSWAVKGAVCHDEQGRPVVYTEDAPWGTSALFVCNANPALPLIGPDKINQASCFYSPEIAKQRYESGLKPEQDGEYIDSVEGFIWPRVPNFREEHFAYTDQPLTFGTRSRRPCILTAFSHWAFLRSVGDDLHSRGKLMFGNALCITFYYFAPHFDVLGTEHGWIRRDGEWSPEAEERTNYRRALCYRKPFLMLLNTDFKNMKYETVEKYMRRCAFFGLFPSMFSSDAFHDRYFDDPKYYDRDRPLFKKYVPIILDIAKAGWCPVTQARCSDKSIRIERFGEGPTVFLSVMNADKAAPRQAEIAFDAAAMALPKREREAVDLFSGRKLSCSGRTLSLRLEPDDVAVVRLR